MTVVEVFKPKVNVHSTALRIPMNRGSFGQHLARVLNALQASV
ncbi:Unknown protein sequence [Pseudomonas amygdali pv. myricae]|nr:Unknown protein sequence [Pseudomonas amygdali pv. myricae]